MGRRVQGTDITTWWVRSPGTLRDSCELKKRGISLYGRGSLGYLERGSFARAPEIYERKALGMSISLYGGSVGQPGMGSPTGDFEIWLNRVLEVEGFSQWELCEGNLKGGLPCLGP
jgi:hypothetical protein